MRNNMMVGVLCALTLLAHQDANAYSKSDLEDSLVVRALPCLAGVHNLNGIAGIMLTETILEDITIPDSRGGDAYYDAHRAVLRAEDKARIYAGESMHKVVRQAQQRFAREHGVPEAVSEKFSLLMGDGDLRGALIGCLSNDGAMDMLYPDYLSFDINALKHFLNVLYWITEDPFSISGRCHFLSYVKTGCSVDEAAERLFRAQFSPEELVQVEEIGAQLPLSVRLRATSLFQETPLKLEILSWTRGLDEERALASLSYLAKIKDADASRFFMTVAGGLSISYLKIFVTHWPLDMSSQELHEILRMGELSQEQIKDFQLPWHRQATCASEKDLS
ncbi:MAG: hypothetical protein LCH26_07530 [Proteobacteria bacterium]|nr:hypothetical protein [Pseudomonadota bacterium]